ARWTDDGAVRLPEGATADEAVLAAPGPRTAVRQAERLDVPAEVLERLRAEVLAAHGAALADGVSALEEAVAVAAERTGGRVRRYAQAAANDRPGGAALRRALASGAAVVHGARVTALRVRRRRVIGVEGVLVDPARMTELGTFRLDARAVLLCSSAIEAVGLVQEAGLGAVRRGATVGLDVTAFLPVRGGPSHARWGWRTSPVEAVSYRRQVVGESDEGRSVRVGAARLEAADLAVAVPGYGPDHVERLRPFADGRALAVTWTGLVGASVRARRGARPEVRRLDPPDAQRVLAFGLQEAARLAAAVGGDGVLLPLSPARLLRTDEDVERAVSAGELGVHVPRLWARTARGGLVAGEAESCVADAAGCVRGVDGLRVAGIAALGPELVQPPLLEVLVDGARVGALLGDALR
ncbi:MAG: hypothetical protein EA398_18160, partial [Deltaproteobacteria bacterium]